MLFLPDHLISSVAVRENLEKCLQTYFVEEKNAKNSHFNGYSTSAEVIKNESRGESDKEQNIQDWVQADDEKGITAKRKSSTGEHDQDSPENQNLLQTIARSTRASPSNVRIEENEHTRDQLRNDEETLEQIAGITGGSRESNKPQDVPITENTDVSKDQTIDKPANNDTDMEKIAKEDSSMAQDNRTDNDENQEIKIEHNPGELEQVRDTKNHVHSDLSDSEPIRSADLNAEQMLNSHSEGSFKESEQHQHGIELNKNIHSGSEQTQPADLSTDQDTESLKREKDDTELDESNVTQQVSLGHEKIDQP